MQTVDCCGLGTDLPGVAAVIIHDTDWNPRGDIQAVARCHRVGDVGAGVPIIRLLLKGTLEEKLIQMAGHANGMEAVYAARHTHRCDVGLADEKPGGPSLLHRNPLFLALSGDSLEEALL